MNFRILFSLALFLSSFASFAQPKQVVADKIIAVIGDKIILKSEIENNLLDMQRQGVDLPPNAECLLLEQSMGVKALVLQAEKDSLPVTDEEVEADIDNRIRYYIQAYGGKTELEKVAGKTIYQLREDMKTGFRDQKLAMAMRNKVVENVRITPKEVKEYFNTIPVDSLAYYESELEIGQIVIFPKASRDAEEYAMEQLKEYRERIIAGKDFKQMAALYSEDPGSKDKGGEYEINRSQKDFDATFMAKAFALKEGQISTPFKSNFGYHIIQMVNRAGDDALVRHILKVPQVTSIELEETELKLDSVRAKLIAGTIDFGTAVNTYSNDETSKFTAGMLQGPNGNFLTIDQLDKEMIPVFQNLQVGQYSKPVPYTNEQGKKGIRVVYLKSKTAPHRENLQDDYSRIADRALEAKKENALEEWFAKKIKTYHIRIDSQYSDCESLKMWKEVAQKMNP